MQQGGHVLADEERSNYQNSIIKSRDNFLR